MNELKIYPSLLFFNSLVGADFNTGVGVTADGSGSFIGLSTVTGGNLIVGLIVCWFCECTLEVVGPFAGGEGFDFFCSLRIGSSDDKAHSSYAMFVLAVLCLLHFLTN